MAHEVVVVGGGIGGLTAAALPEARRVTPSAYVVRLPDKTEVRVGLAGDEHLAEVRAAFPECAGEAERFYVAAAEVAGALERAAARLPALATASKVQRVMLAAREPRLSPRVLASLEHTAARHLAGTSARFRRFIDAQLQIFAQVPSERCAYLYAAVALSQPRRGMYAMRGGAGAL